VKNLNRSLVLVLVLVTMVALPADYAYAVPSNLPVNLSGYEFFLGFDCGTDIAPARCGVLFGGWTGGTGPGPTGWAEFPGTSEGLWSANIDYQGKAAYGNTAILTGGNINVHFKNSSVVSGTVTGGYVTWPASASASIGCGDGIAAIYGYVTINGVAGHVIEGCLRDIAPGTVIPTVWGTLI
jgi:hypothetical protein